MLKLSIIALSQILRIANHFNFIFHPGIKNCQSGQNDGLTFSSFYLSQLRFNRFSCFVSAYHQNQGGYLHWMWNRLAKYLIICPSDSLFNAPNC